MINWQNKAIKPHRLLFFAYCIILGFLANYFTVALPITAPLTVGNVTIFVILVRLGPIWGLISFLAVTAPLMQPFVVLLCAIQCLLFWLHTNNAKFGIAVTCVIYIPICALISYLAVPASIAQHPELFSLYLLACTAVFGWCIKAADMMLRMSVNRQLLKRISLQEQLSYRFGLYTAIPATLFISMGLYGATSVHLVKKMQRYHEHIEALQSDIQLRLNTYTASVASYAALPADLLGKITLMQLVNQFPEFISALITNEHGSVTEFYKADVNSNALIGASVADRTYFQQVRRSRAPYISDTFTGRTLGSDQLFAVSAPVFSDDTFSGIVEVSVKLDELLQVFKNADSSVNHKILLDNAGKKIWGGNITGTVGDYWQQPDHAKPMNTPFLAGNLFNPLSALSISNDGHHFVFQGAIGQTGWTLTYYVDTESTILVFYLYFAIALGLITLILDTSILLSRRFISRYTMALEQLVDYTKSWDGQSTNQPAPEFTQSALEIETLTNSFITMQRRVAGAHHAIVATMHEVRQLNSELEQRVEQRTHELEQERDKANHLAAVKTRFLANMSHELRTPITIIKGFTQTLLTEADTASKSTLLRIQQNTEHLHDVVNDILDVAKMDAGKMSYAPIDFNITKVLDEMAASLRQLCLNKQLSVALNIDIPDTLYVWADPFRFKQILLNLISNAVKFTHQGQITLSAIQNDAGIVISVIDQGVGIAPDKLPTLFQAFTQADSSISRDFGGTGLGLYISKELADAMQMVLTTESKLNHGSIFSLAVPKKILSHHADAIPSAVQQSSQLVVQSIKGKHVLVVDDVKDIRDLIAKLLQETGITLSYAEDGKQAIDRCTKQAFDLILMDQQMPRMDGLSAAKQIRSQGITTPIIQLSADVFTEPNSDSPFNVVLTKPFDKTALLNALNQVFATTLPAAQQDAVATIDDELAQQYYQHLVTQITILTQLSAEQQWELLARELHKIKGTSACFGLTDIAAAAAQAERDIKADQVAPQLLDNLFNLIKAIKTS